jgi:hypothetical protein
MTKNHMVVSMWTEIDETQSEKLSGGSGSGGRPKPLTVKFTVKDFSSLVTQIINTGDGTIKDFTLKDFSIG